LIVRRERPHPGAQLSFTDHDGYRFQAILTDQQDQDIAVIECRHRQRAHVEDRIRDDKDTGLAKLPFKEFQLNEVWLEIVTLAHDLIVWTQALLLDGELAKAEPKRMRYRLLHVAGRLASPAVAPSSTSTTTGPGSPSSPPRSASSKRSKPPPADHHPPDPHHPAAPTATATTTAARNKPTSRPAAPQNHPGRQLHHHNARITTS
jgi:Transposase DDE domain group 1